MKKWCFVDHCKEKKARLEQFGLHALVSQFLPINFDLALPPLAADQKQREAYLRVIAEEKLNRALESTGACGPIWTLHSLVAVGRRLLNPAPDLGEARRYTSLLSGRSHWVYTVIAMQPRSGFCRIRFHGTRVKLKRVESYRIQDLSQELSTASQSGGYHLGGIMAQHIRLMSGPVGGCEGVPVLPIVHHLQGM